MARKRTQLRPDAGRECADDDFPSRELGNRRRVTVRLPPGYDRDPAVRYPVLYLHDGQNVFDAGRAAFGVSWRAGETADRLALANRIRPVILVGIDNTPDRMSEFVHYPEPAHGVEEPKGEAYARFVLDELKPFVDEEYRTLPGRTHTAVAGSSLGGLVSLAMARDHSEKFSRCGILSPSLWWAKGRILDDLGDAAKWMRRMRLWLCMGTREGGRGQAAHVQRARRLAEAFDAAALVPGRDYYYQELSGGEHNEAAWAERFDRVLLYFFGW